MFAEINGRDNSEEREQGKRSNCKYGINEILRDVEEDGVHGDESSECDIEEQLKE